jgi:molecular chaperone GrpE
MKNSHKNHNNHRNNGKNHNHKEKKKSLVLSSLKKKINRLKEELQERHEIEDLYLKQLRQIKADFDHYHDRTEKQIEGSLDTGMRRLVLEVLIVVDNLQRALAGNKMDFEGVDLINREFMHILENNGLGKMENMKKFDYNYHHAVSVVETEKRSDDGDIVEVIQPGYLWKGRVLRPAMVIVSKKKEGRVSKKKVGVKKTTKVPAKTKAKIKSKEKTKPKTQKKLPYKKKNGRSK